MMVSKAKKDVMWYTYSSCSKLGTGGQGKEGENLSLHDEMSTQLSLSKKVYRKMTMLMSGADIASVCFK